MNSQANVALPDGFQLLNYRIDKQLSRGGFSLVYRAFDEHDKLVAIKEYLPSALALRRDGFAVHAISDENQAVFRFGMRCFFEEGRALARIVHPNVVRVLNFFRANETVYMVMRYERGRTMQKQIQSHKHTIGESFIRRIFGHLLNGLREVHTHKLLHLDIKPANIYLRAVDGSPVLLDFGAARQTLTRDSPKLNPMYTPGFAPPEQYQGLELLGPWSDIYSVGASIYSCLAGVAPQPADARLFEDKQQPAKEKWHGEYSDELLEIIDWCLRLDPQQRPPSVYALQKILIEEPKKAPKKNFLMNLRSKFGLGSNNEPLT
ncbi:MAG TPA: serine/threonine-protein kinase [Burkholderiales bacterium]|nr:serine/threonine-protein kinase [Burkholderiales bacterium]